ncbi:RAI1 [Lepeophtheirus salmonis]|uniref:Decapping nuclease n=1 Tax=Lepeophtheirus salmonis TaxID=72036 RepID=A0A7R8CXH9_LEPSM|nr:RAI1 [Lepeophtheirus salmonis]CAF2959775.1 RAI1 [Lepeophtheirus salmonis]
MDRLYRLNGVRDYIDDGLPYLKECDTKYWDEQGARVLETFMRSIVLLSPNDNRFAIEGINPVLEWLHRHPPSTKPDFVSCQGNLLMLMCTPFEKRVPWSYSFVKYDETLCGFRDYDGLVNEIKSFKTADIPSMSGINWRPNDCLGFLRNLLRTIKEELMDKPNVVLNVSSDPPGTRIKIERSEKDISFVVGDKYRV